MTNGNPPVTNRAQLLGIFVDGVDVGNRPVAPGMHDIVVRIIHPTAAMNVRAELILQTEYLAKSDWVPPYDSARGQYQNTPPGTPVDIPLWQVVLRVPDTVPGIPPDAFHKILVWVFQEGLRGYVQAYPLLVAEESSIPPPPPTAPPMNPLDQLAIAFIATVAGLVLRGP